MAENEFKNLLKERTLYRDEIYEYMKDTILTGKLKPGDRIVETRWAKDLGVSQSPVREAIRELEMVGLVENKPFQGTFVREITAKEVKDAYRVRISLEVLGIQDAIKIITDEQLEDLHFTMKEMEQAAEEENLKLFIEKNALFHRKIIEVSDNDVLLKLWSQCKILEWTHLSTTASNKGMRNLAFRHEDIFEAIKERDEKKAVHAIIVHLEELSEEIEHIKE